jgi:hypothetical protein
MTEDAANLVHDILSRIESINSRSQKAYFEEAAYWKQLQTAFPAIKGYNGCNTFRELIVEAGKKPSRIEQMIRNLDRWYPIIEKENIIVVLSRLTNLLSVKHESQIKDLELVQGVAARAIPHSAYKSTLDTLKGKKDAPVCDHINVKENKREQWVKHTCCGSWEQLG